MKKPALYILRFLKFPSRWLGVDYDQLETLLITKLTMDFRNTPAGLQSVGNRKNTLSTQLFMYVVFGSLFGAAAFSIRDLTLGLTIYYSAVLVSLMMTLISEFTSVLFDPRENSIVLPRPISSRTLLMYRLIHIQFYMALIAVALSLTGTVIIIFKYTVLAAFIFLITGFLGTWTALILTTFFYLSLSKFVNGSRFKDIISYAQIIMVVIVFGGYQIMPTLMSDAALNNLELHISWWTYFFPPAWLAAIVKSFCFPDPSVSFTVLALLGIVVPVASAIILIKYISAGFGNILSESSAETTVSQKENYIKAGLLSRLSSIFCISTHEQAGWNITMSTIKRDRKFKQAVYPNFGILLVLSFMLLKPDLKDPLASLQGINEFNKYLFLMILGFSVNNAILQLPYTDTTEANWIYKALPFKSHGDILTGAIKAILTKFLVPTYLLILVPLIIIWGLDVLTPVLLSLLGNILLVLIIVAFQESYLPFTRLREMQQKGMNSLQSIFSMILLFCIAGGLYFTRLLPMWVSIIICCIIAFVIIILFRKIRKKEFRFA